MSRPFQEESTAMAKAPWPRLREKDSEPHVAFFTLAPTNSKNPEFKDPIWVILSPLIVNIR